MKFLTVRRIANAMHKAVFHHLDDQVRLMNSNPNFVEYEFFFDKHFKMKVETGRKPNEVRLIQVILKDEQYELIPFSFKKELKDSDEDEIVIWEQKGPWGTIIEKKVEKIEEAFSHKLWKEEKTEEHFKNYFPNINEKDSFELVPYFHLKKIVKEAEKLGLLQKRTKFCAFINEMEWESFEIDCFTFKVDYPNARIPSITICLSDRDHFKMIFCKQVTTYGIMEIDDVFWKNALLETLNKLKDKIKEKKYNE